MAEKMGKVHRRALGNSARAYLNNGHWLSGASTHILTKFPLILPKHEMAATATLSARFQISIPKAIREEQQWEAGQEFVFIPKSKGVLAIPVPELDQLASIATGARTEDYRDRSDRS